MGVVDVFIVLYGLDRLGTVAIHGDVSVLEEPPGGTDQMSGESSSYECTNATWARRGLDSDGSFVGLFTC